MSRRRLSLVGANWRAVALVALLCVLWAGLYADPSPLRLVAIGGLGLVIGVSVSRGSRAGVLLGVVALVAATTVAAGHGVGTYFTASGWSALASELNAGFVEVAGARYPAAGPAATALGFFLLVLAAVVAFLARKLESASVAALVVLGLAGYRWTVAPPDQATLAGIVTAVVLVSVAVPGQGLRSIPRRTAGLLAMCVVGALGSLAVATDRPVLDWHTWDVVARAPQERQVVSLEQTYGQLHYPEKPVVMFRVNSARAVEIRGAVFTRFDGSAFRDESPAPEPIELIGGAAQIDGDGVGPALTQTITQVSAQTNLLFASGRPREIRGLPAGTHLNRLGTAFQVEPDLARGASYTVTTVVPDPGAAALEAAPVPKVGEIAIDLPGGSQVNVPTWGSGRSLPPPSSFREFAPVAELARSLAKDATTEYEVVVATESYLRQSYSYSETPPTPVGDTPWIVDFLTSSQTGFCQQFANAMALMLQMNGIPARVAVGFTRGSYDAARRDFVVVDRDAHSWVEVEFAGQGWLPFDPTPGRSAANSASASSRTFSPASIRLPKLKAKLPTAPIKPAPVVEPPTTQPSPSSSGHRSGFDRRWLLLALGPLAFGGVPLCKLLRRSRRRRRGSNRDKVLAAGRELGGLMDDLGLSAPDGLSGAKRADQLRDARGVDVSTLVARVERARFGRTLPTSDDQHRTWLELSEARPKLRRSVGWVRWVRGLLRLRSLRA